MKNRSVGLSLVLWCEVIISARVLLFTVPVLIGRGMSKTFSTDNSVDWFIISVTIIAVLYFCVGITAILRFSVWKLFHYVVAAIVCMLTVGIINVANALDGNLQGIYFLPLVFSAIMTVAIALPQKTAVTV